MFSVLTHNSTPQVNRFQTTYTPSTDWNAKAVSPSARRTELGIARSRASKQPVNLSIGEMFGKLARYIFKG